MGIQKCAKYYWINYKNLSTQEPVKLSCKSELLFVVVVVVVAHYLNISFIEYFLSVFPSSFIKISKKLWKWFEFIHHSFLVKKTNVSTMSLYTHVLVIKMGMCCIYAYNLFVWDSRNISGLKIVFFFISQIGPIKRGSSFFCKEMNLKIEPPPHEHMLWNYTNKTLGQLM